VSASCIILAVEDLETWGVDARLAEVLTEQLGIAHFFPLQQDALAQLLKNPLNDACISARTGFFSFAQPLAFHILCLSLGQLKR